ncbi:Histone-Lysine N-Methyltransferase ash1l [Mortierella antarctica]|nr:Histone-Lysine N-Methyltransferase ash1l [Mortierella antarctica]
MGSSTTARGSKKPTSLEESELLREEEEMLAITKMLKSIHGEDSFLVAKQILESKSSAVLPSETTPMDDEANNGHQAMIADDDAESIQAPETPVLSSLSAPQEPTGSRFGSGISLSTLPDYALDIAILESPPSPSPSPPTPSQPEVDKLIKTKTEHLIVIQEQNPNSRQLHETTPDAFENRQESFKEEHTPSEIPVLDTTVVTASSPSSVLLASTSHPEMGELTMANMQRQNDTFGQQDQDSNVHQVWYTASAPSSAPSSCSRLAESHPPGCSEGPTISGKPVSLRKRPGTTRSGRVWTAPPKRATESSDEESLASKPVRRRPGRPRGYYLGPISCAFCRQQHRRCDFNVVCHRCLEAGIPCDRDGTVVRPSILVLQAKAAAKAQAEADREALIAAGLAPPKRNRPQKSPSESDEFQGLKRRRSQSPRGGFSRDNILQRAKRETRPVKKYDPAEDLSAKEYRKLQKMLGLEAEAAQVAKEQGNVTPQPPQPSEQTQQNNSTEAPALAEPSSEEVKLEAHEQGTLERSDTPGTSNRMEASRPSLHSSPSSFHDNHMEIDLMADNFGESPSSAPLPPPESIQVPAADPPMVNKSSRKSTDTKEAKTSKPTAPATPKPTPESVAPKTTTTRKTTLPARSNPPVRRVAPKKPLTRHESAVASFAVDPADLSSSSGVGSAQSTPEPSTAEQAVTVPKNPGTAISLNTGTPKQDADSDSAISTVGQIHIPKRRPGRPPVSKPLRQQTALTPANQVAFLRSHDLGQPSSLNLNAVQPGGTRRPGRPPWKGNYTPEPHIISLGPDREPIIRRGVGRPPNVVRQAIALEKRRQMQERAAINKQLAMATAEIATKRKAELLAAAASLEKAAASLKEAAASLEDAPETKSESSSFSESSPDEESDAKTKSITRTIKKRAAKTTSTSADATPSDQQTSAGKAVCVKPTRAKPLVVSTPPRPVIPMKRTRVSSNVESAKPAAVIKLTKKTHRSMVVSRESTTDEDSESSRDMPTLPKSTVRLVRKTYLKSGLYSSELKVDRPSATMDVVKLPKSMITTLKNQALQALGFGAGRAEASVLPAPHKSSPFPLPIHYGAELMKIKRDFILPFDIMQAWSASLLQQPKQPEPFVKIRSNHLRVIWSEERGFGIQTLEPIKKGSLVIEYRGEIISQKLSLERMEGIYKNNKNFYFLEYEKGEVVDACQKGTNARFVNHSQIEKWFLNGEMSIGIFASQDVPAGAEISYNYNFSPFQGAQKQVCRCGAPNCRGYIGERVSKTKDTAVVPTKKNDGRKHKAGRRKLDTEMSSVRFGQMPTVGQIRQRQSDKYKLGKMIAIRFTRLFLFRNIRVVESKYVRYAQTKSRSNQEDLGQKMWLIQARQGRKRSLEGVIDDLRANIAEEEDAAHE